MIRFVIQKFPSYSGVILIILIKYLIDYGSECLIVDQVLQKQKSNNDKLELDYNLLYLLYFV